VPAQRVETTSALVEALSECVNLMYLCNDEFPCQIGTAPKAADLAGFYQTITTRLLAYGHRQHAPDK
jgi:hypothetical protein